MEFTKDTSKVLSAIYKTYLERIKAGESKKSAVCFDSDFYKDVSFLSSWSDNDIDYSLQELNEAGFIKKDVIGDFEIQNTLIIQMENRFKNGIKDVAKYLVDLTAGIVTGLKF